MAVKGIFYVLVLASDLERSKRFYGKMLGWKQGTDEERVAGFQFGSGYLVVLKDYRPEDERTHAGGMWVEVQVDDIVAEHARLKAAGVEVSEIQDQPWGERNFQFRDPDGYVWSYGQAT